MKKRYDCGVPEPAQWVDCQGVRLAVSREGSGPPVVCLHAVGHGGRDFEGLTESLKDSYEVIRIDWPGHGRSAADRRPASAERYAQLLAMVLEQLHVSNPVIIGNSIGGAAGMIYASCHAVRGLVLCDSGGLVPVSLLVRTLTRVFRGFFLSGARGAGWFPTAYAWYYRFIVLPAREATAQRERIIAAGPECAQLLAEAWDSFGQPSADLREIAANLAVPVWVAWSRSDRVIPFWMCRPAVRRIQGVSVSRFQGGHAAFLEQPVAFRESLSLFLDSLPRAATTV